MESITTSFAASTGAGAAEWSLCPLANVTLCEALEAAVPAVFLQVGSVEIPLAARIERARFLCAV